MTDSTHKDHEAASLLSEAVAIEALGNYQDVDLPFLSTDQWAADEVSVIDATSESFDLGMESWSDEDFWCNVFCAQDDGEVLDGKTVIISIAAVSEWVPRIPGLYWRNGSAELRAAAQKKIEFKSGRWEHYDPTGKSFVVSGGIGTVRLPPSESGYRLLTLSAFCNASTGVPLLVSDDQWDALGLSEGALVSGEAKIRHMPGTWSREFPSIQGLPKICLTLGDDALTRIEGDSAPVQVHPFTVMEYADGDMALLDFVFASADSSDPYFRKNIERFFGRYCTDHGRNGSYLIAADVSEPMWDSVFQSPAEMRGAKADELKLIEHRVNAALASGEPLEAILQKLVVRGADDLRRLSEAVGIPPAHWQTQGPVAIEAQKLLEKVVSRGKQAELILAIETGY